MTAECLACKEQMTVAEFCAKSENRGVEGCPVKPDEYGTAAEDSPVTAMLEVSEPCRRHQKALDEFTAFLQTKAKDAPKMVEGEAAPGDHTGVTADLAALRQRIAKSKSDANAAKAACDAKAH